MTNISRVIQFVINMATWLMGGKTYATSCKRLAEHFTSGPCKGAEHVVQIIENGVAMVIYQMGKWTGKTQKRGRNKKTSGC